VNEIHATDEQLQAYLDGTLAETDVVEAHLASCPHCRQALEVYRQLYTAIEKEAAPELSPDFADRVLARLPESENIADAEEFARGFRLRDSLVFIVAFIAAISGAVYFLKPMTLFRSVENVSTPSLADNTYLSAFLKDLSGLHLDVSIILFTVLTFIGIALFDRVLVHRRRHRKPISYLV
jgi:anti-sigma factor RsiW